MCFWREAEKVHFCLLNEHDAPVCDKLKSCKKQMCSRTGDTSAVGESVELDKAIPLAVSLKQPRAGKNAKPSRVVPTEHLCAVKV